jgi:hypothetical protein
MRISYFLSVLRAAKISVRGIRANLDVLFATVGSDDRQSLYMNGRLPDTYTLSRSHPESLTLTLTHTDTHILTCKQSHFLCLSNPLSISLYLYIPFFKPLISSMLLAPDPR